MGKKSNTKVDAAPVAVVQSGKKGKRGAENGSEKVVNLKKQKVERDETVAAKQKALKKQPKKVASSSSDEDTDDSDSDSDSEPKVAAKKIPVPAKNGAVKAKNTKKDTSSDSSESSEIDSDDSDAKPAAALKNGAAKDSEESETDSDSSDEETVAKAAPAAAPKKKVESSDSDSDEEDDSSDSDEEPEATKPKVQAAKKSDSTDESSEDDDSEEEEVQKTPKKKDTDTEMVDAKKSAASKTPKTPATPEATGSKTLFVANLSFSVEDSDVREFFKEAGEIEDVRFAMNPEGQFRGFGHVEFATVEAAQKAMELNGQEMLDRPVRLDLARERGASQSSENNSSFQKGGRSEGQTAFVRGFDTTLGEDEIRSALEEHFGSCGKITRTSIPPDFESGGVKGMAYINFADSKGFNAALELDGSDLGGGYHLTVQEAKPRGDSAGGSGGRFDRGGGRSGGRRGGRDGGRFSGRGGRDGGRGGRFSGRGGRDGGRGGRGTPYRNSVPSGKKTTFGDD